MMVLQVKLQVVATLVLRVRTADAECRSLSWRGTLRILFQHLYDSSQENVLRAQPHLELLQFIPHTNVNYELYYPN